MDREEKQYFIVGLLIGVAISVIFGIFPILEYYNVPPPDLLPLVLIVAYVLVFCLCALPILFVFRSRKKIGQTLRSKYLKKLTKKIQKDLETEIKNRQLTLLETNHAFLYNRAVEVATAISRGESPIVYSVSDGGTFDRAKTRHLWFIGPPEGTRHSAEMPKNEAEILASKMTEISKNSRYRKHKVIFYLFS